MISWFSSKAAFASRFTKALVEQNLTLGCSSLNSLQISWMTSFTLENLLTFSWNIRIWRSLITSNVQSSKRKKWLWKLLVWTCLGRQLRDDIDPYSNDRVIQLRFVFSVHAATNSWKHLTVSLYVTRTKILEQIRNRLRCYLSFSMSSKRNSPFLKIPVSPRKNVVYFWQCVFCNRNLHSKNNCILNWFLQSTWTWLCVDGILVLP